MKMDQVFGNCNVIAPTEMWVDERSAYSSHGYNLAPILLQIILNDKIF